MHFIRLCSSNNNSNKNKIYFRISSARRRPNYLLTYANCRNMVAFEACEHIYFSNIQQVH